MAQQTDPARVIAAMKRARNRNKARQAVSVMSPAQLQWNNELFGNSMGQALPRDPAQFLDGTFTPLTPIEPVGINVPDGDLDRASPRQREMPPGWNMPVGVPGTEGFKLASFQTLRTYADIYSVARACIQVRKGEIRGLEWDIMPTEVAEKRMRGDASAHREFAERKKVVIKFFKKPDPDYLSMGSYVDALMEEMLVTDALSLYLHPTQKKGGYGPFGKDVAALEIISGSTIRPLVSSRGGRVRPPSPGYQQYLYGVPRVDLMQILMGSDQEEIKELGKPAREYRGDQLMYLPYTQRSWTPYGFPPLERTLIPTITGLRKQEYQLNYFDEGTIPGNYISPGEQLGWTPNQLQIWQDQQNALAGDPAYKHKSIALPPGSKVFPVRPVPLADQFDEIVMAQVCMGYDVMPMEMGLTPKVSSTQSQGAANQMAKATEKTNERKSLKPTLSFFTDIFNILIQVVWMQEDMRFVFEGLEEDEDENQLVDRLVQMLQYGLMSIDECRIALNKPPWGLPITSDPVYVSATAGMVPLGSIDPLTGKPIVGAPPAAVGAPPLPGGPGAPPGLPGAPKPAGAIPAPAAGGPAIPAKPGADGAPAGKPSGAAGAGQAAPPGQAAPDGKAPPPVQPHPDDKVGQAHQAIAESHAQVQQSLHEDLAAGKPMEPPVRPPISAETEDGTLPPRPSTKAMISELRALTRHVSKGRDPETWECRNLPEPVIDYHRALLKHLSPEDAAAITTDFIVLCFGPSTLVAQLEDVEAGVKTFSTAVPLNAQGGQQGLVPYDLQGGSQGTAGDYQDIPHAYQGSGPSCELCGLASGADAHQVPAYKDNGATVDQNPGGLRRDQADMVVKVGPKGYSHGWVYDGNIVGRIVATSPEGKQHTFITRGAGIKQVRHKDDVPIPLYHGSKHEFGPGEQVEPGHQGNFVKRMTHAYVTDDVEAARRYAGPGGHVYEVKPTGWYGHRADAKGRDWASEDPFDVIRKVPAKPTVKAADADPKGSLPLSGRITRAWPGWKYDIQLAEIYAARLDHELSGCLDPSALVRDWLKSQSDLSYAASTKGILNALAQAAWGWLVARGYDRTIRQAVSRVLNDLWAEGFAVGRESGKEMLDSKYDSSFWSKWKPGDPDAARLAAGHGLQQLLQTYGIQTIRSVVQTRMTQLANTLAAGFQKGYSADTIADDIRPVLSAPARARMIAVTELARATTQAAVAEYRAAGQEGKKWSVTGIPPDNRVCPRCLLNGAQGTIPMSVPFESGDEFTPAHPECRCAILPDDLPDNTFVTPGVLAAVKARGLTPQQLLVVTEDLSKGLSLPEILTYVAPNLVVSEVPSKAGNRPLQPDYASHLTGYVAPKPGEVISKDRADYRPFAVLGQRCGTCSMYSSNACTLVEGGISADYTCRHWRARPITKADDPIAGGLAVRAKDTGRVLMIQRAHDEADPAGGYWEFPGGRTEPGENVEEAAKREWVEETGLSLPAGDIRSLWDQGNYRGHVMQVASEDVCPILDREKGANPDDPDNDETEALAWWDPAELKDNPVIRPELREHPKRVRRALEAAGGPVGKSILQDLASSMDAQYVDEHNELSDRVSSVLRLPTGRAVYEQLAQNYPPDSIEWVKRAEWRGPYLVSWDLIDHDDMDSWAASHQPGRVDQFADKIEAGDRVSPVVLVSDPDGNYIDVDGHHRALAYHKLSRPVRAWVGIIDPADRKAMEETHLDQVHEGASLQNKMVWVSTTKVGPKGYIHGWIFVGPGVCKHGCGTPTKGHYAPGHDAKHVKALHEAIKNGEITHAEAHEALSHSPKLQDKLSAKLGTPKTLDTASHPAPGEAVHATGPGGEITVSKTADGRTQITTIKPGGVGSTYEITARPDGAGLQRDLHTKFTYLGKDKVQIEREVNGVLTPDTNGPVSLTTMGDGPSFYKAAFAALHPAQQAEAEIKPKLAPKKPKTPAAVSGDHYGPWKTGNASKIKDILSSEPVPFAGGGTGAHHYKAYVASRIAGRMSATPAEMIGALYPPGWNDVSRRDQLLDAAAHPENYTYSKNQFGGNINLFKKGEKNPITGNPVVGNNGDVTENALKEYAASELIQTWAGTSNDSNTRSLAIQHAAQEEFGLENVAPWAGQSGQLDDEVKQAAAQHGAVYREFLRTQYNLTQEDFKKRGITSVNVSRGMAWGITDYGGHPVPGWTNGIKTGDKIAAPPLRPISSWTVNGSTATSFAQNGIYHVTLKATVPASAILSWPRSGFGCKDEYELVVLAGNGIMTAGSTSLPG